MHVSSRNTFWKWQWRISRKVNNQINHNYKIRAFNREKHVVYFEKYRKKKRKELRTPRKWGRQIAYLFSSKVSCYVFSVIYTGTNSYVCMTFHDKYTRKIHMYSHRLLACCTPLLTPHCVLYKTFIFVPKRYINTMPKSRWKELRVVLSLNSVFVCEMVSVYALCRQTILFVVFISTVVWLTTIVKNTEWKSES